MKMFLVWILTLFVMLVFLWLQINVFNYFALFGIIPNIGIILVISISLCSGKNIGAISGFIYGALFDVTFENGFGNYMLLFGILGYLIGHLKGDIALDNQVSLLIVVILSTVFFEIANVLVLFITKSIFEVSYMYIFKVLLLEVIYNIFLTFVMYKPLMLLGDIINRSRRAYYEL